MAKWSRHSLHTCRRRPVSLVVAFHGAAAAPMKWTSFACLPPSKVCSTAKPLTLPSPPPPPSSTPVMVKAFYFICLVKCFFPLALSLSATVLFSVSIASTTNRVAGRLKSWVIISWLVIVLCCWCRFFLTCGSAVLFLLFLLLLLLLFTSSFPLLHLFGVIILVFSSFWKDNIELFPVFCLIFLSDYPSVFWLGF